MKRIDFYFDFSCPYAYLGATQIEALAARVGAELCLKPMLLGGVFKAHDVPQNLASTLSPAKAKHNASDMQRWATRFEVPLVMPKGHPMRTVDALRAMLAVGAPYHDLMHRFYRAYWVESRDVSSPEVIADVLTDTLNTDSRGRSRGFLCSTSHPITDLVQRPTDCFNGFKNLFKA